MQLQAREVAPWTDLDGRHPEVYRVIISRSCCGFGPNAACVIGGVVFCLAAGQPPAKPIPIELEGRITSINSLAGGPTGGSPTIVTINVMGVPVTITPDTQIHSPVTSLAWADLMGKPFPGRSLPGFLGGTGIIEGFTVNGVTTATHVSVEPSENVLIGEVTDNVDGTLWILGVEVQLINDWRMYGDARTELGFLVDLQSVLSGTFAVAEGYFGDDGVFHAFAIEAAGEILGPPDQTSITRAICVANSLTLDVRGGSTSTSGLITIFDDESGALLGTALVVPDEDSPTFGKWRFDEPTPKRTCPAWVRAENTNGSVMVAEVDVG